MKRIFSFLAIIIVLFSGVLVGCSNNSDKSKKEFSFHDIVFSNNSEADFEVTETDCLSYKNCNYGEFKITFDDTLDKNGFAENDVEAIKFISEYDKVSLSEDVKNMDLNYELYEKGTLYYLNAECDNNNQYTIVLCLDNNSTYIFTVRGKSDLDSLSSFLNDILNTTNIYSLIGNKIEK